MYVLKVIIVEHQSVADDMDRAGSGLSCFFESCNAIIGEIIFVFLTCQECELVHLSASNEVFFSV